jgi:HD-like signal output (HDOD) protein
MASTALSKLNLRVPTLPSIVRELTSLIDRGEVGPAEVGRKLAGDGPLTVKVLHLANSPAYGLRERCSSIEQACAVLGMRVLRSVVFHACVLGEFERLNRGAFDLGGLWLHSLRTAQVCTLLARHSNSQAMLRPDDAYLCGLLHDIGQVVLLDNLDERYIRIHARAKRQRVSLDTVERAELGIDHAKVGELVLDRWGFPAAIQTAVRLHHARGESDKLHVPAVMLSKANLIVGLSKVGSQGCVEDVLDPTSARMLGLLPDVYEVLERYLE